MQAAGAKAVIREIAGVLLPVFGLAGVGYAWRAAGARFDLDFVTRLIVQVAGPCLVFQSLSRLALPLEEFLQIVWASIAMMAATALASAVLLRLAGLSIRSYLPALAIGNTGNLGLPLALFAFGEHGLALAIGVFVTNSIFQFTLVPMLQSGAPVLRTLVTTPMIYASAAGLLALVLEVPIPQWLGEAIGLLADLTIPLMLLALGHTLGGLRAANLKLALGLGTARLVLSFAIALGVSELMGVTGMAQGVLILQGVMPAAVFTYLFAVRYERDAEDVAGIVLVSTLLAAVLLPGLVPYLLGLSR